MHIESYSYVKRLIKQHFDRPSLFSSTSFISGTNFLIAFLIGTRSFAPVFQTDFFSLVHYLMHTVFLIFFRKIWSLPTPNENNPMDLHQVMMEAILQHR